MATLVFTIASDPLLHGIIHMQDAASQLEPVGQNGALALPQVLSASAMPDMVNNTTCKPNTNNNSDVDTDFVMNVHVCVFGIVRNNK